MCEAGALLVTTTEQGVFRARDLWRCSFCRCATVSAMEAMNRNILEVLGVTAKPQKQGGSTYQNLVINVRSTAVQEHFDIIMSF